MAGGWAAGAASLFAFSAILMGAGWVGDWWARAGEFAGLNLEVNGVNFVSLPGFLENLLGAGSGVAAALGYGLAVVVGAMVAVAWWRDPRGRPLWRWALVAAAMVVVAPQTLYYDAGLLLLALVAVSPLLRNPAKVVAVAVALTWTQLAASGLGWSPLGPVSIAAAVGFLIWQARPGVAGTATP